MDEGTRLERRQIAKDERAAQAVEAPKAMAEYVNAGRQKLDNLAKLRAERRERENGRK